MLELIITLDTVILIVCLQLILEQPQSVPQTHYYLEAYHRHNIYLGSEKVSLEREFYFSYLARKERERGRERERELGSVGCGMWDVGSLKKQKVTMRDLDDWIQVFELI